MVKPFFDKIAKTPKDYVLTLENVLCDKYESSPPRIDQIKERAPKIAAEIVAMIDNIKKLLTTDPSIDSKVIFAFGSILDKQNFVLPNFLYKIEYLRVEFDSFGRMKNVNDLKVKTLWLCFFILKIAVADLLAALPEITGQKLKPPMVL